MDTFASKRKTLLFRISGMTMALLVVLVVGELGLRLLGFDPWSDKTRPNEPIMLESHPIFGWQSKEGIYHYSPLSEKSPARITILPDGIRSSGPTVGTPLDDRPNIMVVGCSFLFGWAISDQDTLAWKLQEVFPEWHVLNYATVGYGTYQSLLRMEESLPKQHPDVVLYGMIEPHEGRNVASAYWLHVLAKRSRRGHVSMPYVTFNQGRLERHGQIHYSSWPGRKHSALITAMELSWAAITALSRTQHAREATQETLLEMKELADQHHARFLIAFLGSGQSKSDAMLSYIAFAEAHQIPYVDCRLPGDKSLTIPNDGHPNEKANARWFEFIEPVIRKILTEPSEPSP